jgi:hypothetical protein
MPHISPLPALEVLGIGVVHQSVWPDENTTIVLLFYSN